MGVGAFAGADGAEPGEIVVADFFAVELAVELGKAAGVEEVLDGGVVIGEFGFEDVAGTGLANAVDGRMRGVEDAGGGEAGGERGAGGEDYRWASRSPRTRTARERAEAT